MSRILRESLEPLIRALWARAGNYWMHHGGGSLLLAWFPTIIAIAAVWVGFAYLVGGTPEQPRPQRGVMIAAVLFLFGLLFLATKFVHWVWVTS